MTNKNTEPNTKEPHKNKESQEPKKDGKVLVPIVLGDGAYKKIVYAERVTKVK